MSFFSFAFFLSTSAILNPSWGAEDSIEHSGTLQVIPSAPPLNLLERPPPYGVALRGYLADTQNAQDEEQRFIQPHVNDLLDKAKKTAKKNLALDSWTQTELEALVKIRTYGLSSNSFIQIDKQATTNIDNIFVRSMRKKKSILGGSASQYQLFYLEYTVS